MAKSTITKKEVRKMLDKAVKGVKRWDVKQDKKDFGKILRKRVKR
jgi:hypothetical protein